MCQAIRNCNFMSGGAYVDAITTDLTKKRYNRISKVYDLMEKPIEVALFRHWRKDLLRMVSGGVLEVGIGTGKNIPYYPKEASVVAVDISKKMLEKARKKATHAITKLSFAVMDAENLALKNYSFGTIVATFAYCSVPDAIQGFLELKRVCKKDGRILLLEHVRSRQPLLGKLMDFLNPLTLRVAGFNINRETGRSIKCGGLNLILEKNLKWNVFEFFMASP